MKATFKKIDGILLLDKPLHITSNSALQRVKRLFGAKKAGHTGSLDPLATGMLPVCFGEATKVSQFLLDSDKHYQVEAKLGMQTTTGDAEGDVTGVQPIKNVTIEAIIAVLQRFTGKVQQIPPMFSAIKHQGKPLYELARKGIEIERKPRTVQIHSLQFNTYADGIVHFTVHCSKGTYIRTLVTDIGEQLGCGAYVFALRRSAVSPYQQNTMYTLAELEHMHSQHGFNAIAQCLLPLDTSVQHLPMIKLSSSATFYVRMGQAIRAPYIPTEGWVRIFADSGQFMGIGEVLPDGKLAPRRLVKIV